MSFDENNSDDNEERPTLHIMLSYQWDNQKLVEDIYKYLKKAQSMPVWMDKHGGMQDNVLGSMSEGIENCAVVICFLTPAYQASANCKRELTYALDTNTPIIPVILGSKEDTKWKPTDWLGMSVTNLVYLNFRDINPTNLQNKCQELLTRIQATTGTGNN